MNNQEQIIELANKRLKARDQNGDGKISKQELKTFYTTDHELREHFSNPDLIAMAEYYFHKLDQNNDGFITLDELK